jgi:cytochrome c biogenesis protein CcmG, thiol:disulfide interchange protein DsbE
MKKAALVLVVAFALFGCSRPPAPTLESTTFVKGPLPDFELENIAGGKTKADAFKGKVMVVDFWATWCEPCLVEVPKFNKLADEFKGKDVGILGIAVESPYADIKPKVDETKMKYTVLVGNDSVSEGFGGVFVFPTTFVVTKDWKIYKKYMGSQGDKDNRIRKDIEKLLADEAAPTD